MTKLRIKLLVFLGVLVCSLCLCLGITACSNKGEHRHTFGGFWLFDGEAGHFRFATCHPEVKSALEPHVDKDGDNVCDVCGYLMHVHVDGDGDNFCDECHAEIHKHTYEDGWTFSESKHWHEATCDHFIERGGFASHDFISGVCECGVKESEVKVYALYKNSLEYKLYYTEWLEWLAENGVIEVEYTASGDGIYHYADHSEVRFLGERTVKVKAVKDDNEPLSDVWFMVTLFSDNEYYQNGDTIALGIAKTDENGIAEIPFTPVGGYSSEKISYRIRIALSADVALAENVDENEAMPIPNRYVMKGNDLGYFPYEVSESANSEDIAVTVEFTFSKNWNAYNTIELPYHRYFKDQLNATGIEETGKTFEFVTSGDNLFDYMYLFAAQYSFVGVDQKDKPTIEENAKLAAQGEYKIIFIYTGNANVVMYSWNASNISFDNGAYTTKEDGTPADKYANSISGGTAGDGVYTGGNFIDFTVRPDFALRNYQFGIISDIPVSVRIIVERIDDYKEDFTPDFVFEVDSEGNGKINEAVFGSLETDRYKDNQTVLLGLENMSAGTYVLQIAPPSKTVSITAGSFYARFADGREYLLWQGSVGQGKAQSLSYKNVITITNEDTLLYISDYNISGLPWNITLEKYEPTTVTSGAWTYVPSTPVSFGETYQIPLNVAPGTYTIEICTFGANHGGERYPFTVNVGNKVFTIKGQQATDTNGVRFDYDGTITVDAGDSIISLNCSTAMAVIARVMLTAVA